MPDFNYTTGTTSLPDIGVLSYNGVTFSPLVVTSIQGKVVPDEARRTTKYMEYRLSVEGYVTANTATSGILTSTNAMRKLLQAHGGELKCTGRGFDLISRGTDVAWGPVPELIEFQPLGGGNSAKVKWEVTFRTPDVAQGTNRPAGNATHITSLLQFNYETSLSYNEDYYSSMSIKGTMEIPLTRPTNQTTNQSRQVLTTVDAVREELDRRIFAGIDLSRFYVVKREFNVSRDKRTMEFQVQVEEKAYMDMPANCTVARGSYNVRPAKSGPGLVMWMCTLRGTYTVAANQPRRVAWDSFLLLLKLRMKFSSLANINGNGVDQAQQNPPNAPPPEPTFLQRTLQNVGLGGVNDFFRGVNRVINHRPNNTTVSPGAWLIDFSFDEGIYKDSKTITFSATWRMVTTLSHILLASGVWKKLPEVDQQGRNLWAASMEQFSGHRTWLTNRVDNDIIIDFGY